MKQLNCEIGLKEFQINDQGILRFNPTDPAVFSRLEQLTDPANMPLDQGVLAMDKYLTEGLDRVFPGNDFAQLLQGVSPMAMTASGKLVFHNLVEALMGIMTEGMDQLAATLV